MVYMVSLVSAHISKSMDFGSCRKWFIIISTLHACFLSHDLRQYNIGRQCFIPQNLAASFIGDHKFLGKFLEDETDSSMFIISSDFLFCISLHPHFQQTTLLRGSPHKNSIFSLFFKSTNVCLLFLLCEDSPYPILISQNIKHNQF